MAILLIRLRGFDIRDTLTISQRLITFLVYSKLFIDLLESFLSISKAQLDRILIYLRFE